MKKKQQRAELIEAERRARGERTSALDEEELNSRVRSGKLQLPRKLLAQADALALPIAKSVEPSGIGPAHMRKSFYPSGDSRLQPVAYDQEKGHLQPYTEIESFEVPCKITISREVIDPVIIEVMPIVNRGAAHNYLDACDLDAIEPSELLLPPDIQQAIRRLDYPDRGLFGEGLACLHEGKLLVIQTSDHLCSNEFFRCGDIVGSKLLNKELVKLEDGTPYPREVFGSNEIKFSDVQRVLALAWR